MKKLKRITLAEGILYATFLTMPAFFVGLIQKDTLVFALFLGGVGGCILKIAEYMEKPKDEFKKGGYVVIAAMVLFLMATAILVFVKFRNVII